MSEVGFFAYVIAKMQNKTPRKYKMKYRENTKQNTAKMQNKIQRKCKTKYRENIKQNTAKMQNDLLQKYKMGVS